MGHARGELKAGRAVGSMLKTLAKGLLGRFLGYGGNLLGFWLLYQAFSHSNPALGVLGGVAILVSMYLIVMGRRQDPASPMSSAIDKEEKD